MPNIESTYLHGTFGPAPIGHPRTAPAPSAIGDAAPEGCRRRLLGAEPQNRHSILLGITVVLGHARWVAAAAAGHAGPSPGPSLAAPRSAGGVSAAVATARRGGPRTGPGAGAARRDRAGAARGRARLEARDRGALQQGGAVRRHRPPQRADAGARSPGTGPPSAHGDPQRGSRGSAGGGLVRPRPGVAGPGGPLPVTAARAGAGHHATAADQHRRRRVGGARGADRLAHLGDGARPLPRARGQPLGAAGAAPRPRVLPARPPGPGVDSAIGGRLSNQALQVTFAKHAVRTAQHLRATAAPSRRNQAEELAHAYQRLSYDSFRRLALAAGAPPVSARGVVRAARAVARSSRLAG